MIKMLKVQNAQCGFLKIWFGQITNQLTFSIYLCAHLSTYIMSIHLYLYLFTHFSRVQARFEAKRAERQAEKQHQPHKHHQTSRESAITTEAKASREHLRWLQSENDDGGNRGGYVSGDHSRHNEIRSKSGGGGLQPYIGESASAKM